MVHQISRLHYQGQIQPTAERSHQVLKIGLSASSADYQAPMDAGLPCLASASAATCELRDEECGNGESGGQACFVCMDAAADAMLIECGHGGLCAGERISLQVIASARTPKKPTPFPSVTAYERQHFCSPRKVFAHLKGS
jgi:hypothetical protein